MDTKTNGLVTTALGLALFTAGYAFGHSGATGIVKERMDGMKAMSKQAKLVSKMSKGEAQFDKAEVVITANLFVQHGEEMLSLFPNTEQSRHGKKTEALPKIWKDWEGFEESVDQFVEVSKTFRDQAVSSNDDKVLRKPFKQVLESCSGCHKSYRKPKRK